MGTCQKEKRPILKAIDHENNTAYLYQPRCKMWSCEPCAVANKLLWQARIGHGYEHYLASGVSGWNMLTITSHQRLSNAEQCLFVWRKAWPKLSARMRRKYPGFKYVILPEYHNDSRVHWHMIASNNITTRWLKDNSVSCGLGYMAQSDTITDGYAAIAYVSKYIGKSITTSEWPKNLKRISTSQKWPELPPEEDYNSLELSWSYHCTYYAEGIAYIADELQRATDMKVKILS